MSNRDAAESYADSRAKVMETYFHEMSAELSNIHEHVKQQTDNALSMDKEIHRIWREIYELREVTYEGFRQQQKLTESLCVMVNSIEKKLLLPVKPENEVLDRKDNEQYHQLPGYNTTGITRKSGFQDERAEVCNMLPTVKNTPTINDCGVQVQIDPQTQQVYENR